MNAKEHTGVAAVQARLFGRVLVPSSVCVLMAVLVLTLVGLVVLASASQSFSREHASYFRKQLIFSLVAVLAGFGAYKVNIERLRKYMNSFGIGIVESFAIG